jgi:hypothetical protein
MPPVAANERTQTQARDRAATGIVSCTDRRVSFCDQVKKTAIGWVGGGGVYEGKSRGT